jgi:hypothetical protein
MRTDNRQPTTDNRSPWNSPHHPRTVIDETNVAEKLSPAARFLHDQPIPFHLHGKGLQLVQHDPANTLSTQFGSDHKIVDTNSVAGHIDRQYGNELANELADETARWDYIGAGMGGHKGTHFQGVRSLDWPHKQALPAHG